MVRPKLVEEGTPIGDDSEPEDHIDELIAEEMARTAAANRARQGHSSARLTSVEGQQKGSSLLRALGGKLPPQTRRTKTSFGGDSIDAPHQEHGRLKHNHTHDSVHYQNQHQQGYHHQGHPQQEYSQQGYHLNLQSSQPDHTHAHATHFVIGGGAETHAQTAHYPSQQFSTQSAPLNSYIPQQSPLPIHPTHYEIGSNNHVPDHSMTDTQQFPSTPVVPLPPSAFALPDDSMMHTQQFPPSTPAPLHQRLATHSKTTTRIAPHRTHFEIGADERPTQRMEGVEDHSIKAPLVVLDGANIAYAYGSSLQGSSLASAVRPMPDARGIRVACRYFQKAHLRVLVVLPSSWFRMKPRATTNSLMETDHLEAIDELHQAGLLVPAPPTDDDDAYALTIAQRENLRADQRGHGPGFVLSNDLFRDAQERDGQLKEWLSKGNSKEHGPGRISYAFCDMGTIDDYGERELDFIPNPRHPLVAWIEKRIHQTNE